MFRKPDGSAVAGPAWWSSLRPGMSVGVKFDDDSEDLWHERLLLWPCSANGSQWYVVTPDSDKYVEDLTCPGGEDCPVRAFSCSDRRVCVNEAKGKFYRFRSYPSQEDYVDMLVDARAIAIAGADDVKRPKECLGMNNKRVPTWKLLPEEEAGDDGETDGADEAAPAPAQASMATFAGHGVEKWISLENAGGLKVGAKVQLRDGDVVLGDRGIHRARGGDLVAVRRAVAADAAAAAVELEEAADDAREAGGDGKIDAIYDARLLGDLRYDAQGKRVLPFLTGVNELTEEELADYPLDGGRTLRWLAQYTVSNGGTFDGRHTKWCLEQKVELSSVAGHIHDLLGFCLDLAITYDQVDASNLACLEVVARTYQLVEETGGSMQIEGLEHYVGRSKGAALRRGIALAPSLATHATERQGKETAILKERRKAREERAAAGSNPKGGGKAP